MGVVEELNVRVLGDRDGQPVVFAHGFGCDQQMWRHVTPGFTDDCRVVVFDIVGCGRSDATLYDPVQYRSLDRYAADVLRIVEELDLYDAVLVGHSVSAMIGALATIAAPERFAGLVMVSPSPRYIDDGDYIGGFTRSDIDELLDSLDSNYLGWSHTMAPVIMSNPDRPELADELEASFCRVDPAIARQFARVTFLSDNRGDLENIPVPTLVVQCAHDAIAPTGVGEYVHQHVPASRLKVLDVAGHCPNLSAPSETAQTIRDFIDHLSRR
ncbi:MAG: alpha/beta fold hydrolase [Acidimicrobiales bacterium]